MRPAGRTSPRITENGERSMARSAIEWTESTWNPVTGCTKISPGRLSRDTAAARHRESPLLNPILRRGTSGGAMNRRIARTTALSS